MEPNQEDIRRILSLVADSIESGRDFALEQAPELAREIVVFGRITETAGLVLPLLLAAGVCVLARRVWRCSATWHEADRDPARFMAVLIAILACLPATIFAMYRASGACMAWFAPKLYILNFCLEAGK